MSAAVLWPERESLYSLMLLRASVGHAAFESEKQSNPVNPDACEWPDEYFTRADFWFDRWPENLIVRVLALDPSKGARDDAGDYQAFVRWGCDLRGVEYVEADLRRQDVEAMACTAVEHVRLHRSDAFALEGNVFQELLAPVFAQRAAAEKVELRLELLDNTTNKEVRIRRLTEPLAQRKVRFKARSPGTQLLVQQLRDFPNADHDDGPDSWEMARRVGLELVSGRREDRGPRRVRP